MTNQKPSGGPTSDPRGASKAPKSQTQQPWTQPSRPGGLGSSSTTNDIGASSGEQSGGESFATPVSKFPDKMFSPGVPQMFNGSSGDLAGMPRQAFQSALQSPYIQSLLGGNGLLSALLKRSL